MDSFDEIYDEISKKCKEEKRCGNCCNLEKNVRTIKYDYSFSDEAKKICKSLKKILKGGPKL